MSTEALASLYTDRLQGSQIRLLRLLPTTTCCKCGHIHLDENDSDYDEEDCKTDVSDLDSVSVGSEDSVHDACRGHGCIDCDRIRCELIVVPLEDIEGDFVALSYVWGYPFDREAIKVNGTDVPATMNLEAALRRVRNTEKAELLWVDAICINQTDIPEKNAQVMRMKEIYTKASRVLVWAGDKLKDQDEDDGEKFIHDAETSMKLLKNVHRIAQGKELAIKPDPYNMFVADMAPFEDPTTVGLPSVDSKEWDSLNEFLSRPWFSRVWIIQEVASASEAILLVGKDAMIGWKQTAVAIIWLLCHGYPDNIPGLHNCWNILTIDACRRHNKVPLLLRLSPTATFSSTLPHDKIYALLGMTIEGQMLEKYPRLRIDYGRDWRELYRDVVRHCIETPGSFGPRRTLHVLNQVRHNLEADGSFKWNTEQSSWVPSWDDDNQHCPVAWQGGGSKFKSTKDTDAAIVDSGSSRILSLNGVLIDKIAKVYPHLMDADDDDDPFFSINVFRAVAKLWAAITMNWKLIYHNRYPHLADAFAKVLTTAPVMKHGTSEASAGMYFAAYWEVGLSIVDESDSKFQLSYLAGPVKKDVKVWDDSHDTADDKLEYYAQMASIFKTSIELDKLVLVTEKGYLGIGTSIAKPGDEVCVLYGSMTPFVVQKVTRDDNCPEWLDIDDESTSFSVEKLKASMKGFLPFGKKASTQLNNEISRTVSSASQSSVPRKDVFRLVGECYVEGLIDGEALDQRDASELVEKTLHLV
ncbi:Nn.00g084800.m01.CDS01 [Neocucurbitaria sp. VM-36]